MPQIADAYDEIKQSVLDRLQTIGLQANGQNIGIYNQIDIDNDTTNIDYPCVVAITSGLRRRLLPGDSVLRQYEYPVGIMILDRPGAAAKAHENEGLYVTWMKQIDDAFHQRRLGLFVVDTRVEDGATFDQRLPKFEFVRSTLIVWCEVFDDRN